MLHTSQDVCAVTEVGARDASNWIMLIITVAIEVNTSAMLA